MMGRGCLDLNIISLNSCTQSVGIIVAKIFLGKDGIVFFHLDATLYLERVHISANL